MINMQDEGLCPVAISPKTEDSPELRHGRKYYLANYDWDEREGVGDFTYVDRESGEAVQVQRSQRRYHIAAQDNQKRGN